MHTTRHELTKPRKNPHKKPYLDDSSVSARATNQNGGGPAEREMIGQKAIIAYDDNGSGVIKYRSEQDMVSICE